MTGFLIAALLVLLSVAGCLVRPLLAPRASVQPPDERPALRILREQRRANEFLEPLDLERYRGLASPEHRPCLGVSAKLHHREEGAQQVRRQIGDPRHGFAPSMNGLRQSIFLAAMRQRRSSATSQRVPPP